jgi:hypothetical protein
LITQPKLGCPKKIQITKSHNFIAHNSNLFIYLSANLLHRSLFNTLRVKRTHYQSINQSIRPEEEEEEEEEKKMKHFACETHFAQIVWLGC